MFDWTVNLAKNRGVKHIFIEASNYINEQLAVKRR